MLSYSRTPVPVRDRSLSLDQTVFVKEKKSVEEAAQYNQWRRETSETDLYGEWAVAESVWPRSTSTHTVLNLDPDLNSQPQLDRPVPSSASKGRRERE
jgi:hypothetical protein